MYYATDSKEADRLNHWRSIEPERQQTALQHLKATELSEVVTFLCLDIATFLQNNQIHYDFILLNAERPAYPSYWGNLKMALQNSGSVLVVDNVLSHVEQVKDFIMLVKTDSNFEQTILPIGAGLLVVVKK